MEFKHVASCFFCVTIDLDMGHSKANEFLFALQQWDEVMDFADVQNEFGQLTNDKIEYVFDDKRKQTSAKIALNDGDLLVLWMRKAHCIRITYREFLNFHHLSTKVNFQGVKIIN